MFKYSTLNQKKIEGLLEAFGYKVRYEKGNFQSGYCIVQDKKIAVINKFYDIEAKINTLMDIILSLKEIDSIVLEAENADLLTKIRTFRPIPISATKIEDSL